jgi:hypothetical protein
MAPNAIPNHDAAVAGTIPSCAPATVLTALDGIGSRMSVASIATVPKATTLGAGGGSSHWVTCSSSQPPKLRNGITGTSKARQMMSSGRQRLRME